MRKLSLAPSLGLYLFVAALAAPAYADPPPAEGRGMLRAACKADVETLCKGIQPGGGRIRDCLKANADKVSQGCKDAMAQAKARHDAQGGQGAAGGTSGQTPAAPPQ